MDTKSRNSLVSEIVAALLLLALPLHAQMSQAQATAALTSAFQAVLQRPPNLIAQAPTIAALQGGSLTPSALVAILLNSAEYKSSAADQAAFAARLNLTVPTPVVATPNLCAAASTGLLPLTGTLPAPPQICYQPPYPTPTAMVAVSNASQLQAALTAAACGQLISVLAGTLYPGNYTIPPLVCPPTNPVLVASSQISAIPQWQVPARTLAGGSLVATLQGITNGLPTLTISDGASGWYFAGIDFTIGTGVTGVYPIVAMGDATTSLSALPSYITFDRILTHPATGSANYVRGGIDFNCTRCSVNYSNIWGIVNTGIDTQAILVQNSPGPILISGNDLEATGENILLGTECVPAGCTAGIPSGPIPSDVTVTRNHLIKQAAWQNAPTGCSPNIAASCYDIKNTFEIKMGQRVLVDSNWFDTTFLQFQQGTFAIMNCPAAGPYTCTDWTVTNNLFTHGSAVAVVAGNGNSQTGQRILFRNNLAVDISGIAWGGLGLSFQIQDTNGFIGDHNTIINTPPVFLNGLMFADPVSPSTDTGFVWTNNIHYGSPSFAGMSPGQTIAALPGATFSADLFVGDYWPCNYWSADAPPPCGSIYANPPGPLYPTGITTVNSPATPPGSATNCSEANKPIAQCWPLDWALAGFVDFAGCNAGTDLLGCSIAGQYAGSGANVTAAVSAIAGVQ